MRNSKITLIIPTFNRESTIVNSVKSIKAQDFDNWELIVVDDGSQDGTRKILKPFLSDKRIRYYYQENQGVSSARNTGANLATGDYLIFLDSDDVFYPNLLSTLQQHKYFNFDIICWEVVRKIDQKERIERPVVLDGTYNNIKAIFLAGSICFKKTTFFRAGGYDPKMTFSENYELGIRVSHLENLKIKLIETPLLKYEVETSKRISNSLPNRLSSHIYQYKKHKILYGRNKKAGAEMKYLIGYVLEKSNKKYAALQHYKSAWLTYPLNFKAFIKILILKKF
ncbi:glycosyltransferase family 2 protein [Antarcticibacterium arcticum]|uniref:Glycosyltransferase family 2 protein n=1 Tax=Antarcticibacterium arcticum TaxID=2585771 RepID=A0A5B8YEZ3_9FLAO|nr:glycosyltransferase family A protein [Antarcticibacterium arcticum]QED36532.1 glycosyltransferase family 2 protein [Antarcticibacterium arcticum]